jgi:DNA-binding XRE family transcriptional regulator
MRKFSIAPNPNTDNFALEFFWACLRRLSRSPKSTLSPESKTMGHSRPRPKHLAKKLLQIRLSLGVSQGEMVKRLGVQDLIHYTTISKYELDKNEPPLAILLAYARLAEIPVEQIIDDEIELTV